MSDRSQITPEVVFQRRRRFLKFAGAAGVGAAGGLAFNQILNAKQNSLPLTAEEAEIFNVARNGEYGAGLEPSPYDVITGYNNFYEFGYDKGDPARHAHSLQTSPWAVEVGGLVENPQTFSMDEILKRFPLEERVYRFRCVEAWSMVIPWVGFPLAALVDAVRPTADAKFVAFETLYAPEQMPGQSGFSGIDFPYREGLRLDEATNPLTLLAVGVYGKPMPKQNGAPIRLVVPWKYGFKSIKSIVKISFVKDMPRTTWMDLAPREYGFYANVNPEVSHPRWSQASERIVDGGSLWSVKRQDTLMFNGYEKEVAHMYQGMDLRRNF
ncbi:protein-methionine-sulfoxide reductase catalytic subunit MsrP [Cardiobacteriaceae bacterium TAE3-ERU3]|nr:protein-methionine-sulfoxide reductase catalytic subunit MsrP [Cardiobacteriaceae bacterium TAE3-ERU3]